MVALPSQDLSRYGIGGSECAAAAGLSPYVPPILLWLRKVGLAEDEVENEPMYWGSALEPVIRARYVANHNARILVPERSVYHPKVPWARATPDGLVLGDGDRWERLHEIKAPGFRMEHRWGYGGTDEVPVEYLAQGAWYRWIMSAVAGYQIRHVDYSALIGGQDYREYTYTADAEFESSLVANSRNFWERYVLAGVQPPVDASEDYARYVATKYPWAKDVWREATERADQLAKELKHVYAELARLTELSAELKTQLKIEIGEATGIKTCVGKLSWKQGKKTRPFKVPRDWEKPKK